MRGGQEVPTLLAARSTSSGTPARDERASPSLAANRASSFPCISAFIPLLLLNLFADLTFWISLGEQAKRRMGRVLQLASFSLAEVTYATGDISYQVRPNAHLHPIVANDTVECC